MTVAQEARSSQLTTSWELAEGDEIAPDRIAEHIDWRTSNCAFAVR